jgi:hypothetical protein
VLPLARRTSSCFAARSRAGLRGARSTRAQTHRHAHMPCPLVWHAGVKNVRPVALPGFRASAQEDQAEGLAADLSRRSALAVRAPHVSPHAVLSIFSCHLMPPSLPRLFLRSHRDDRPAPPPITSSGHQPASAWCHGRCQGGGRRFRVCVHASERARLQICSYRGITEVLAKAMQCFHTMQHASASKPAACMLCLVHAMPATVSSPKNDPYYKKMIENQDPRSQSLALKNL